MHTFMKIIRVVLLPVDLAQNAHFYSNVNTYIDYKSCNNRHIIITPHSARYPQERAIFCDVNRFLQDD